MFDFNYIAIDLKSFYASVECVDRGLNPLTTNLVVADASRTEKTVCLAVTPSLKAYGVGGRARLFEVVARVREVNADRLARLRSRTGEVHNKQGLYNIHERPNTEHLGNECLDTKRPNTEHSDSERFNAGCPRAECQHPLFESDLCGRNLASYRAFVNTLFTGASFDDTVLRSHDERELDYVIARPRMKRYIEVSTEVYKVYLKYFSPEDIHVYSIDEVFIDISKYKKIHTMSAQELASEIITDVQRSTGITATAGIGTNLFLAKVALDVLAKHEAPDKNNVRIAVLNEQLYKKRIWPHQPITDIWRVGKGYARKLQANGMYTMGDVARCSLGKKQNKLNEDLLYSLFGKNAELLIDHAWGIEPVTIADIKAYKPSTNCKAQGQVLPRAYTAKEARLVAWEMADTMAFDLLSKDLTTNKLTLSVHYDSACLENETIEQTYTGEVVSDWYGRCVPKPAHGTTTLSDYSTSSKIICNAVVQLYDAIVNSHLLIRRIYINAQPVITKQVALEKKQHEQLSLFEWEETPLVRTGALKKEECLHQTILDVRNKYGKNAVLRAANLQEGATAKTRNGQVGGHRA